MAIAESVSVSWGAAWLGNPGGSVLFGHVNSGYKGVYFLFFTYTYTCYCVLSLYDVVVG